MSNPLHVASAFRPSEMRRRHPLGVRRGQPDSAGEDDGNILPARLPRYADLTSDLRFLRNPHYDPILGSMTGQNAPVAPHVEADPALAEFWNRMTALLDLPLPRHAADGKKYLTIAPCRTGGRPRSVFTAEPLARPSAHLAPRVDLSHRESRVAADNAAPSRTQELKDRAFPS